MKYFLIEANEKIPQPQFFGWYEKIPPHKIKTQDIPRINTFNVKLNNELEFMDILSIPFFMLSKEFYTLLLEYDSSIKIKYAVLHDKENHRSQSYGLPYLHIIDCLAEGSEYNLDKSVLKKGIICHEQAKGHALFQLGGVKSRYIVANLDFVESMYRRQVQGLQITELDVMMEGGKDGRI